MDGSCPTVFMTDRDTIVVQGYRLAPDDSCALTVPEGETIVEIPMSLLVTAAARLA